MSMITGALAIIFAFLAFTIVHFVGISASKKIKAYVAWKDKPIEWDV